MDYKFKELLSLVNEYLEGYTSLDYEEILERIDAAYHSNQIEGNHYDYLTRLLEE